MAVQAGQTTTVKASDGTAITVQAGSLSGKTVLSIYKDTQSKEPKNPNIKSYSFAQTERTFGPEGTVFNAPVTITIPFSGVTVDSSDIPTWRSTFGRTGSG
jgi:hypothetical protein